MRQIEGPVRSEPGNSLVAWSVEHDAPRVEEEDAIGSRQRARRPLLGDEHGARQARDQLEERVGSRGVELRRRLVEQEQLRPQREGRGERHALKLARGQLRDRALRQVLGADLRERLLDARPDLGRVDPGVLEPERDLVRDPAHHDLVLDVLEDGRDDPGKLGRTRLARVDPADDHTTAEDAAVEVRHQAGEGAEQRRLARARSAEHQHVLAVLELERDVVEHGGSFRLVREAQPLDGRYSHSATTTMPTAPTSAP